MNDAEAEAMCMYRLAGSDGTQPIAPTNLVPLLLGGRDRLRYVDARHLRGVPACLCTLHGLPHIFVRRGLALEALQFLVAHELAEWWLRKIGYRGEDSEDQANMIAAALVAPRPAVRAAVSAGESLLELAEDFGTTQTCVALRIGEVTGRPLAVVAPQRVRVRGEAWAWPETEQAIRRLGKAPVPQVERVEISDQPKRFVLFAEAA